MFRIFNREAALHVFDLLCLLNENKININRTDLVQDIRPSFLKMVSKEAIAFHESCTVHSVHKHCLFMELIVILVNIFN